jgi:hypothetical protein
MPSLLASPSFFSLMSNKTAVEQILKANERSILFGLALTRDDALELLETRTKSLSAFGRVEIGSATISKIIEAFCDSAYLYRANYAETLHELVETFYYFKNESLDLIADDDLIAAMKHYYENCCQGSLELLQHRELERLARNLRYGLPSSYEEDPGEDEWL